MISKIKNVVLIFVVILLTATGCKDLIPDGFGRLSIDFGLSGSSRTILYDLSENDVKELRIRYDGPSGVSEETIDMTYNKTFLLPCGNWTLSFFGLDSEGVQIVSAEVNILVENTTHDLSVLLKPGTSGSGYLNLGLDWSAAGQQNIDAVNHVEFRFGKFGGEINPVEGLVTDLSAGNAYIEMDSYPSGNYIAEFILFNSNGDVLAFVSEAVNIRDNLSTTGVINLDTNDFSSSGTVNINIGIDVPEEIVISFNRQNDVVFTEAMMAAGVTIKITNTETFDSYAWFLDGVKHTSTTDTKILRDVPLGIHRLTAYVEKDDVLYSGTLRFIVE